MVSRVWMRAERSYKTSSMQSRLRATTSDRAWAFPHWRIYSPLLTQVTPKSRMCYASHHPRTSSPRISKTWPATSNPRRLSISWQVPPSSCLHQSSPTLSLCSKRKTLHLREQNCWRNRHLSRCNRRIITNLTTEVSLSTPGRRAHLHSKNALPLSPRSYLPRRP